MIKRKQKDKMFTAQEGRCYLCGEPMSYDGVGNYPTLDHIRPRGQGGSNDTANLALACLACNQAKADIVTTPPPEEANFIPCHGCLGPDRDPDCLCR